MGVNVDAGVGEVDRVLEVEDPNEEGWMMDKLVIASDGDWIIDKLVIASEGDGRTDGLAVALWEDVDGNKELEEGRAKILAAPHNPATGQPLRISRFKMHASATESYVTPTQPTDREQQSIHVAKSPV
jgi:hypothetical protein